MSAEKSDVAKREEEVLAFWQKQEIFKKSLEKPAPRGEYIFYDGPPFANGLPHYGHILASTIKDAIPRFRTMCGYRVPRQWGWDCHGLPVENLVEKELGFSTKRDIERFGVAKFNEAARTSIMKDVADWKRIIPRMGRWADMDNDYKTMDAPYTESVWWSFKELWKKGLVEKSFKSMHLCPHCGTTLSNFEVSQGYKDIQDLAVTVKLELKDEPGTFLLAWTTTPWTLPGNFAAAVNPSLTYVVAEKEGANYIVAKERLAALGEQVSIVRELPGAALVGKRYTPPFSYYEHASLDGKDKAWMVYAAEFVTAEDGTGIVHIAPAFGDDDLQLAKREGLPVAHHVDGSGVFAPEVSDFAGQPAKPKGDHQAGDIEILKNLAHRGLLFAKEKITHSYPHCWRCETPLLNYASTSWFVNVPAIKNKLVAENKKIGWVPKTVGEYRFGNWLDGAREWAISRSRFWGAPLPIWEAADGARVVVGSKEELKRLVRKSGNRYFTMRHGEAENNVKNILNCDNAIPCPLTERGRMQAALAAKRLPALPGLIVTSPVLRARETAEAVRAGLGLPQSALVEDSRIAEVFFGDLNNKSRRLYLDKLMHVESRFATRVDRIETWRDVRARVGELLAELEATHRGKTILLVSHDAPILLMHGIAEGLTEHEVALRAREEDEHGGQTVQNGEVRELSYAPLPYNAAYELDYHRPYIDSVVLVDGGGKEYRRVPEVFDCWFESGAMPFSSKHYPVRKDTFDPKRFFGFAPKGYPADFIAEGLDQTRGWFYSLIVLGIALFGRSPYKNVIVNGLVLAEDGQKMSKRLKNYPDPLDVVNQYGADAMRYYLLSSPVVRGEDLNFSLKGVQEVASKITGRLANVLAFYRLYEEDLPADTASGHVLDRWMLTRLAELTRDSAAGYEAYELDAATRPLLSFVDDLSVWYLRRSRDRIKDGGDGARAALSTLRYVLKTTALVMAPAMPFFADYLYRAVREEGEPESVHLAAWPLHSTPDTTVLARMDETRAVVTRALEARDKAGVKVRQPLSKLEVGSEQRELGEEYLALVREEVNVKEVVRGETFALDTNITPELREDGAVRELIRAVQDARKQANLTPKDIAEVVVAGGETVRSLVAGRAKDIQEATNARAVSAVEGGEPYTVAVKKVA